MKISINKFILGAALISLLLFSANLVKAQALNDYRDALGAFGSGNWSVLATWQRWNGVAWVVPTCRSRVSRTT